MTTGCFTVASVDSPRTDITLRVRRRPMSQLSTETCSAVNVISPDVTFRPTPKPDTTTFLRSAWPPSAREKSRPTAPFLSPDTMLTLWMPPT